MIRLQADNDDGDQVQFSWSVIPQQVPDGGEAASEVYYWGYSGIQPRKRVSKLKQISEGINQIN